MSLLPLLSGRAGASSGTDASTTTEAPTTTSSPPRRPTDDDASLLGFAQGMELAIRELFDLGLSMGGWADAQSTVVLTVREAHEAFAQALAGLLGRQAPGVADAALVASLRPAFSTSPNEFLTAAYELESAAVATHAELLASLQGIEGAALVASIQSAEARHCTVLADLAGVTDDAILLVDEEAKSLAGNG
ncbi:MAG: ferritin-like domain-containing protein [Actinomycetota bacterium]|nr:ferritin-like domain-containing protein [Actinomycetota bacterium]